MKLLPQNIPKTIVLPALAITLLLCGIARLSGCGKARPRLTMAKLDAEAQKYIDQANAGIPHAVTKLCKNRTKLFCLVLKDRCSRRHRAERYIASVIEPDVLTPLRKAAAIYACAVDKDASVEMVAEAAKDNLDRKLYAFAGLAIEAVFVRATIQSCLVVLGSCAPRLTASWGIAGTCALADGRAAGRNNGQPRCDEGAPRQPEFPPERSRPKDTGGAGLAEAEGTPVRRREPQAGAHPPRSVIPAHSQSQALRSVPWGFSTSRRAKMSKLYYVNIEETVAKTVLLRARTANKAKNKALAKLAGNQIDMADCKSARIRIAVINTQGRRLLNQEVA